MAQLNSEMKTRPDPWPLMKAVRDSESLMIRLSEARYRLHRMLPVVRRLIASGRLAFDRLPYVDGGYSRTILYRDHSGFEVMAARWAENAVTPVHGHPEYAFVFLVTGALCEVSYSKTGGRLAEADLKHMVSGGYAFERGVRGRFDNSIHQIFAVQESVSLHIYSDDASRGEIFNI